MQNNFAEYNNAKERFLQNNFRSIHYFEPKDDNLEPEYNDKKNKFVKSLDDLELINKIRTNKLVPFVSASGGPFMLEIKNFMKENGVEFLSEGKTNHIIKNIETGGKTVSSIFKMPRKDYSTLSVKSIAIKSSKFVVSSLD